MDNTNDAPKIPDVLPCWDFGAINDLVVICQAGNVKPARVRVLALVGDIVSQIALYNAGQTPVWSVKSESTACKTLGGVCSQIVATLEAETFPEGRPTQHFALLVSRLCQLCLAEAL